MPSAATSSSSSELPVGNRPQRDRHENPTSPLLPAGAAEILKEFPARQFFAPGGVKSSGSVDWQRGGFLDLYSGQAEVAWQISRQFTIWVLTFDFTHDENQNFLDMGPQSVILELLESGAVLGCGAAPECCGFSRAITPAVRDVEHHYAALLLQVVLRCIALGPWICILG